MSEHANNSIRLFTSLTFIYAAIEYSKEKKRDSGYLMLVDENPTKDPDFATTGQHEEKA